MARSKRVPTLNEVTADLKRLQREYRAMKLSADDYESGLEVRLQVYDTGESFLRYGDPGYDTDHNGHWGSGVFDKDESPAGMRRLAMDLLSQVLDSIAQD